VDVADPAFQNKKTPPLSEQAGFFFSSHHLLSSIQDGHWLIEVFFTGLKVTAYPRKGQAH